MQRPITFLLLGLVSLAGFTQISGRNASAAEAAYPSEEFLRRLQLDTIICARDNLSEDCDKARSTADPLLDNPLLGGNCKDALWDIRQRAVVGPAKDFQRREQLTNTANDMMRFCRRKTQPLRPADSQKPSGGSGRPGGFGFGLVP